MTNQRHSYLGKILVLWSTTSSSLLCFIGTRNEDKGFVTGLHTSHLNFDEKVLINVVNFYENLLNNYKEV